MVFVEKVYCNLNQCVLLSDLISFVNCIISVDINFPFLKFINCAKTNKKTKKKKYKNLICAKKKKKVQKSNSAGNCCVSFTFDESI